MSAPKSVRVAVTQHEPVWLDLQATVDKTCKIIKEAADAGAKLVAFPECWIPGQSTYITVTLFRPSKKLMRMA